MQTKGRTSFLLAKDGRVPVALACLADDTKCPVCFGILRQTVTSTVCLHRFCAACINTCLAGRPPDHKDCPVCRTNLHSHRSLRPDPSFDRLLMALYGDVVLYGQSEDALVAARNAAAAHAAEAEAEAALRRAQRAAQEAALAANWPYHRRGSGLGRAGSTPTTAAMARQASNGNSSGSNGAGAPGGAGAGGAGGAGAAATAATASKRSREANYDLGSGGCGSNGGSGGCGGGGGGGTAAAACAAASPRAKRHQSLPTTGLANLPPPQQQRQQQLGGAILSRGASVAQPAPLASPQRRHSSRLALPSPSPDPAAGLAAAAAAPPPAPGPSSPTLPPHHNHEEQHPQHRPVIHRDREDAVAPAAAAATHGSSRRVGDDGDGRLPGVPRGPLAVPTARSAAELSYRHAGMAVLQLQPAPPAHDVHDAGGSGGGTGSGGRVLRSAGTPALEKPFLLVPLKWTVAHIAQLLSQWLPPRRHATGPSSVSAAAAPALAPCPASSIRLEPSTHHRHHRFLRGCTALGALAAELRAGGPAQGAGGGGGSGKEASAGGGAASGRRAGGGGGGGGDAEHSHLVLLYSVEPSPSAQ